MAPAEGPGQNWEAPSATDFHETSSFPSRENIAFLETHAKSGWHLRRAVRSIRPQSHPVRRLAPGATAKQRVAPIGECDRLYACQPQLPSALQGHAQSCQLSQAANSAPGPSSARQHPQGTFRRPPGSKSGWHLPHKGPAESPGKKGQKLVAPSAGSAKWVAPSAGPGGTFRRPLSLPAKSVEQPGLGSYRSGDAAMRRKSFSCNNLPVITHESFRQTTLAFCFAYATISTWSVLSVSHLKSHSIANPCRYLRFYKTALMNLRCRFPTLLAAVAYLGQP